MAGVLSRAKKFSKEISGEINDMALDMMDLKDKITVTKNSVIMDKVYEETCASDEGADIDNFGNNVAVSRYIFLMFCITYIFSSIYIWRCEEDKEFTLTEKEAELFESEELIRFIDNVLIDNYDPSNYDKEEIASEMKNYAKRKLGSPV